MCNGQPLQTIPSGPFFSAPCNPCLPLPLGPCSDLYLLLLLHAQPHVEAATVYGLRGSALLVFVPKYHLKVLRFEASFECLPPILAEEVPDVVWPAASPPAGPHSPAGTPGRNPCRAWCT